MKANRSSILEGTAVIVVRCCHHLVENSGISNMMLKKNEIDSGISDSETLGETNSI